MFYKRETGFTLIELLIVIAIIGILAVAFLPSMFGAPSKARDTQRIEAVNKIASLLMAKLATGEITLSDIAVTNCLQPVAANPLATKLNSNYLPDLGGVFPKDPKTDNSPTSQNNCIGYYYAINCGGASPIFVMTRVENVDNGNIANDWVCNPIPTMATSGQYYVSLVQK